MHMLMGSRIRASGRLRTANLSYYPHYMVEKHIVRQNG